MNKVLGRLYEMPDAFLFYDREGGLNNNMTLNKLSCIIATGLFISMFSFDSMASTLDNADSLNLSDIYYEQEIDEYEESKRIIKYGIQNTGTLDGVLGTKYSLTLTDITPDDFTFSVLIGDKETVWTDLTGEIVGDELVYYLPTVELNSLDKIGYQFKFYSTLSENYEVHGEFEARLAVSDESLSSEDIFNIPVGESNVSNILNAEFNTDSVFDYAHTYYTVYFDVNNNDAIKIPAQKVKMYDKIVLPDTPEAPACLFKYWGIQNGDVIDEFNVDTPITSDIVLVADWNVIYTKEGFEFGKAMRDLLNCQTVNNPDRKNADEFLQSKEAPGDNIPSDMIRDMSEAEDGSTLLWYDESQNKVFWWSKYGKMYLPSMSHMFSWQQFWMGRVGKLPFRKIDLTGIDYSYLKKNEDSKDTHIIIPLEQWGDVLKCTSAKEMFAYCSNLEEIVWGDFPISEITDMNGLFYGCTSLKNISWKNVDTSKVTDMRSMFTNTGFEVLDLSDFDTSGVIIASHMFDGATNLVDIKFGPKCTFENTQRMIGIFKDCTKLTDLDLSTWNTSNVVTMSYMFHNCTNLSSINFGDNFITSSVNTGYTPASTKNVESLGSFSHMFDGCSSLTSLDLSGFDTSNARNMAYMFHNCSALQSLDVSGFDTSSVDIDSQFQRYDSTGKAVNKEFGGMAYMFSGCSSLETLDVSNWNTSKVTNMRHMFDGCNKLTSLDVSNWNTGSVDDMSHMFNDCKVLKALDVSNWDISNVSTAPYMDGNSIIYRGLDAVFASCNALTYLDVSKWDTSNVKCMRNLFSWCNNLENIDVSNWDTGNVTEMAYMFRGCNKLSSIDVSKWDTSSVNTDHAKSYNTDVYRSFSNMFESCSKLTSIDLSGWNTANAKSMRNMFYACGSLTNIIYGSNFKNDSCTDFYHMISNKVNKPNWTNGTWDTEGTFTKN